MGHIKLFSSPFLPSVLNNSITVAQAGNACAVCNAQVNRSQRGSPVPALRVGLCTEPRYRVPPLSFLEHAIDQLCVCLCY